jgi:hypothetical protein
VGEEASDDEAGQGAGGGFRETSCVPVEPYGFIFDSDDRDPAQDVPLSREAHATYAPIASFYCGAPHRFADLPLPTSEDWEAATGLIFPPSFKREVDHKTGKLKFDSPRDLFTGAPHGRSSGVLARVHTRTRVRNAPPPRCFPPERACAWCASRGELPEV